MRNKREDNFKKTMKNILKNKRGKSSNFMWFISIMAIILVATMIYVAYGISQTQVPTEGEKLQKEGTGGTIVTTNPIISIAAYDRQAGGTAVTTGLNISTNGGTYRSGTSGTTTAVPGQTMELLLSTAATYHNAYVSSFDIAPGTFPISVPIDANASITENIYTNTGLVIVSDGSGQNQTDLGNGIAYNFKDEMTAGALQATNDMTCIVEVTAGTNASQTAGAFTYGGIAPSSTAKPNWYSVASGNSNVYLFDIPSIKDTTTVTRTLIVTAKSNGRFSPISRVLKSCYTKEWFIDPNTGQETFAIADSNGNVMSRAIYKVTVNFA